MRKTKLALVAALFLAAVCGVLPSSGSVTKARLGDLTRNSQVVTDLNIGTNDVSEAIAGLLTTNISVRIDANTKRINTLYTKTAFLSLSNDINSARISGLSDVTSGQGAQISNLNARVRAFTPYEAYATLTQLSPTIRITDGVGSGIGFYVRCTDSQYHDLRDALKSGTLDPAGHPYPTMDYALTNLYGRTFTTNYLSALYGGDVSWTSNLTATATNVASSLSAVCGGTGYPLCYGREATVRELLCDILYLDPTVWRDDAAASGHGTDATDFSGLSRTVGAALTYARYGHAETAQLRHDYEDGPAFGTPLLTYVRHAVPGSTSLAISPDTVDVIDVSNAVSLVTIRPQMPSPDIDDRRTASCSALIRVHAETTVRVLAQSWDEYIGNRVFTATPGDHLLTVDRVAMPDGWNATYCARLYSLDYQLLPPNFTTNNVILVNTVTNLVASWALFGKPKPEGGGGSGNVDTNAVRDILKDGLTAAVTNGWTVGTGTNAVAYRLPTVVGVTNAAYAVVSNAVESWALKGKGYPTPAELGALPDNYDILITNVAFTGAVERVAPPADYSTSNATLVATIDSRIGGGGPTVSYVTRDPDDNNDRTAVTVGGRPAVGSVDAWSPYTDYNQGDLVVSNGIVFVCIAPPNVTVEHSDWTNQVAYWRQTVVGVNSFAAGTNNVAAGANTHASGLQANAEGTATLAEGIFSHAEGTATHAEGVSTYATGLFTHAEGTQTRASGMGTHAEGNNTEASGLYTHAEGLRARASGLATHAEGHLTAAAGLGSHAEGSYTVAGSHGLTSGSGTATVYRAGAHAAGWGAVATNQTAFVWQGLSGERDAFEEPEEDEYYADHGAGTFNLNPIGGLLGIWIGGSNLYDHIVASSPPVVLPQYWALANVTNASGEQVEAADVSALSTGALISDWPADIESREASYVASAKLIRDKTVLSGTPNYVASIEAGGNALEFTYGDGSTVDYEPSFEMSYPDTMVFKDPYSSKISFWNSGLLTPSMLGLFVEKPSSTSADTDKGAIYYSGTPAAATDARRQYYLWDGYRFTHIADADNLGVFVERPLDPSDASPGHIYYGNWDTGTSETKTRFYFWDGTRYTKVADDYDYTDVVRTSRTVNGQSLANDVTVFVITNVVALPERGDENTLYRVGTPGVERYYAAHNEVSGPSYWKEIATMRTNDTDKAAVYDSQTQTLKTADGLTTIPTMDYEAMTNTVNDVKAKFYDEPLETEWTVRMVNGEMKLYATTNVNTSVLN